MRVKMVTKIEIENKMRKYLKDENAYTLDVLLSVLSILGIFMSTYRTEDDMKRIISFIEIHMKEDSDMTFILLSQVLKLTEHILGKDHET
jgi:hypothetical protein